MKKDGSANRWVKDTVFKDLFSDSEYLLQLYQTLHPEDKETTADKLEIVTLQNILMNGIYNDLGFLANDHLMILVEAQSTWSPNIIIRALIYLMSTYQEYFNNNSVNLYGTKAVTIPKPEIYVIYTQEQGDHPVMLSLQETFFKATECCIEAKAKVIYADGSHSIIDQYIKFCMVFNAQIKKYSNTQKAIEETIRICQDEDCLREYLERRRTEVEGIMLTLFDQERVTEIYGAEKKAEGMAEGMAKGILKAKIDNVIGMFKEKIPVNIIARITQMEVDQIIEIGKKNSLL